MVLQILPPIPAERMMGAEVDGGSFFSLKAGAEIFVQLLRLSG